MSNMEGKKCKKCGEYLPLSEFPANKNASDGHSHLCKRCLTENKRLPYLRKKGQMANPDRPLAKYTPRQLMEELKLRGYDGEITYVQKIRLSAL
jgi:hypothetical protein